MFVTYLTWLLQRGGFINEATTNHTVIALIIVKVKITMNQPRGKLSREKSSEVSEVAYN